MNASQGARTLWTLLSMWVKSYFHITMISNTSSLVMKEYHLLCRMHEQKVQQITFDHVVL